MRAPHCLVFFSVLAGCTSTPLGTCPSGSPVTHCVARADAWNAVYGGDASADGGQPQQCPSSEMLGPDGMAKLGMSGYRLDGEPTWESSSDRCCYKTVSSNC